MSGLVKAKKYNWKDSNMALFGSDTDRDTKKQAAQGEAAWHAAGKKVGLQVWRINKFKVESWPTDQYGEFFSGDSYIILNTYKDPNSDELLYDVHFWIGKYSTQDEYGTAAYKTVELDTFLDDKPIQHREVQGHESPKFKSYFSKMIYNKGGADSGFRHVEPEKYEPRMYKVATTKGNTVEAKQVKISRGQITCDDCYVLDDGNTFYNFIGKNANRRESYRAAMLIQSLKPSRPDSVVETVEEEEEGPALTSFNEALERVGSSYAGDDDDDDDDDDGDDKADTVSGSKKLFRVSEANGEVSFKFVKEGTLTPRDFDPNDVFILDAAEKGMFVWNGKKASCNERANGFSYAHNYLQKQGGRSTQSVTVLGQTQETKEFRDAAFAA